MAYIDKTTAMQRVALISKANGDIMVEGVIIEDTFLGLRQNYLNRKEIVILDLNMLNEDLYEYAEYNDYLVVFRDEEKERWVPRDHSKEYQEGKVEPVKKVRMF